MPFPGPGATTFIGWGTGTAVIGFLSALDCAVAFVALVEAGERLVGFCAGGLGFCDSTLSGEPARRSRSSRRRLSFLPIESQSSQKINYAKLLYCPGAIEMSF